MTEEQKQKIKLSCIGRIPPMLGKKHNEEARRNISEGRKGIDGWNKGKIGVYSEETRKKMSESAKKRGCNHSKEFKEKMSIIWKSRENPNYSEIGTRRKNAQGYILLKLGEGNWIREHIHIMEQKIGRKINKRIECVHHIDKDKSNNDISNLSLMTHKEHKKLHIRDSIHKKHPDFNYSG